MYSPEPSYDTVPPETPDGRLIIDLPYQKKIESNDSQATQPIRNEYPRNYRNPLVGCRRRIWDLGFWGLVSSLSVTFRTSYGKSDTGEMTNRGMGRGIPFSKMKNSNPNDHL